jgi:hypothetical protein
MLHVVILSVVILSALAASDKAFNTYMCLPWACSVKLFTAVILPYHNELEYLSLLVTSTLDYYFQARLEPTMTPL